MELGAAAKWTLRFGCFVNLAKRFQLPDLSKSKADGSSENAHESCLQSYGWFHCRLWGLIVLGKLVL